MKVTGLKETINGFKRYQTSIPNATRRGMWDLVQFGARAYKQEARNAGLKPSGLSQNSLLTTGTRAEKRNKDNYVVVMPPHGMAQDHMKSHYITLKRGRKVFRWVQNHKNPQYRTGKSRVFRGPRGGLRGGFLYVSPRPFMQKAERRIVAKAKTMIQNEVRKETTRKR